MIAHAPQTTERAILTLTDDAHDDIEVVLASRRKLPMLSGAASQLKAQPRKAATAR